MSAATEELMADDTKKTVPFQIRCAPEWLRRVQEAADSLGISAASYIRMVVTQRMNQDNVPKPRTPKK